MFPLLLEPSHLVNSARVNKSYGEILIPPADLEAPNLSNVTFEENCNCEGIKSNFDKTL